MDLNKVAKEVTLKEGKKKNLSVADVKEVMRIIFTTFSLTEIIRIKLKYKGGGK